MPTAVFDLPATEWRELGVTPCLLQNRSRDAVAYVLSTEKPASLEAPCHILNPVGATSLVAIGLTGLKVYGRSIWQGMGSVAISSGPAEAERYSVAALFSATLTAPLAIGKLVQTFAVAGVKAGDTLVATARTPLPAGITLAGEVTAPAAGKVTIAFVVSQPLTALLPTPVAIDLTPLR